MNPFRFRYKTKTIKKEIQNLCISKKWYFVKLMTLSLELLIQLVTMFGVSVDEYIFPDNEVKRSSVRRRLDAELDKLNDKELSIVEATVSGLCKAKEPEE